MVTDDGVEKDATEVWEDLYGDGPRWSGKVNPVFAEIASGLAPGAALDLGCGEGGDALWLAANGWIVTAVDISPTALGRGEAEAARRGVGDAITWCCQDLSEVFPDGSFDLVSAQFLHSPVAFDRDPILQRAVESLAPGGSLVIVGHAKPPSWANRAMHHHDVHLPTADEVVQALALPDGWAVVRADHIEREATGPDGQVGTLEDSVVIVRRDT